MPYKICDKCGLENGVRTKICSCGTKFPQKSKREKALTLKTEEVDWKQLKPGDRVKIFAGSGPFCEKPNGEKVYIGLSGKFEVHSVDKEGFFVFDGSFRAFCYMGETKEGVVGLKQAHKVEKIKWTKN